MKISLPFMRLEFGAKSLPESYESNDGWDYLVGLVSNILRRKDNDKSHFRELSIIELEQAYKHPIIFACIGAIKNSAGAVRFEVGRWTGAALDEWKPLNGHWALELIECPNKEYTRTDFMQYTAARFALTGAAYTRKLRNGMRRPSELWPLPTSWVTPIPGRGTQLISGYRQSNIVDSSFIVPPEDMMVMRMIDPGDTTAFVAPLNAAGRDYQMDIERENYIGEMMVNMDIPGLMIKPKRNMLPEQKEDAYNQITARTGAKGRKRGSALILPGETDVSINAPLKDFDWPGLTSLLETRLCAVWGVPPIVAGLRSGLDRATYSNYEQALKAFYLRTMAPLWDAMAAYFTLHLLRNEGEPLLEFRARYDELPEFQPDQNKLADRLIKLTGNVPIISRDEARNDLGKAPDDEWNKAQAEKDSLSLAAQKAALNAPKNPPVSPAAGKTE